jgi:hypothetical protein
VEIFFYEKHVRRRFAVQAVTFFGKPASKLVGETVIALLLFDFLLVTAVYSDFCLPAMIF